MADKAIDQMISAFAAGCLDKNNFIQFKKYIQKGGEVSKGEIGEQQNVMSLIPTILEIEKPDLEIKEEVAKKIIEIQEKIKTRDLNKLAVEPEVDSEPPPEGPFGQKDIPKDTQKEELIQKPLHDTDIPRPTSSGPPVTKETVTVKTRSSLVPWTLVIFMLTVLIIATVYFMKLNSDLEEQVIKIKNQLVGFQSEIANTNEFINDHLELIEFFNYKDVRIVNLLPIDETGGAWGRLLISFSSGEGLLQLKNMPALDSDEVYQLWMVSKDVTYPLSSIITRGGVRYYKISNIPYIPAEDVNLFRITKEARAGAIIPEGTAYLYGIFLKEPKKRRR
jgi:hypothetical protein